MPGNGTLNRRMIRCIALLLALALSGCSIFEPQIEPIYEPEIVSVPVITEPEPEPEQPIKPPEPPRLPPVAIVLTSKQPAFLDVANALTEHLDDFQIFDLSDSSRPPVSVLRGINDSNSGTVVAIGLRAAKSSVAMADMPVIFSQVFNHQDYGFSRIGIIVGEGHDDLITEARLAAQKHDVELRVRIASSDQETLYLFRRMSHDIDGFWLFPDNRILSARSLQQILESAKRGQVAVAVPYESMLTMGATISMATQADDIAATIAKIIRQIHAGGLSSVPAISPLSAVRVVTRTSAKVANR